MEGKRLDLDAPLISVRRIAAFSAPSKDAKPQSRRGTIRSDHVENSGAVPFIWEKRPGHSKDNSGYVAGAVASGSTAAVNLPPGRILVNASQQKLDHARTQTPITSSSDCGTDKLITAGIGLNPADFGEKCDASSDSRDTLSCNESSSMKSDVTCLSASPSFRDSTCQISKDLQMEEYMMGRFLPAAQAMAYGSPQWSCMEPPRAPVVDKNFERKTVRRRRRPLHFQYQLSFAASYDNGRKEDEEEKEEVEESHETGSYESTGYFSSKARGLISRFGLKSSICPFNPVPGMNVQDLPPTKPRRMYSLPIRITNEEGIVEAVYRHRLRNVDYIKKNVGSKLPTESNQLTYLIDTQTPEGSPSFHFSSTDALSPKKNGDVKNKSKSSKPGSINSSEEDIGNYREMASSIGWPQGSCSTSPATDKTHLISSQLPDTSNSNPCLVCMTADTKVNTDNGYTLLSEFQRTEGSVVAEISGRYQPQSKFSGVHEPSISSYFKTLKGENKNNSSFKNSQRNNACLDLKADGQEKSIDNSEASSLLPPPSPKPPSDSWLQRTLPSISVKVANQQSFLGTKFHPMNQTLQASRGGQKLAIPEKSSKLHP